MRRFSSYEFYRECTIVRAIFHYIALTTSQRRRVLAASIPEIEDIKKRQELTHFEKVITQLAFFEVDNIEGIDKFDRELIQCSLLVLPVLKNEVNSLSGKLKQYLFEIGQNSA
jgi:hypothetical protein